MWAIELKNIAKTYRRGTQSVEVLSGLQLNIAAGEFISLMGPSGSGKTTLLNLVAGLDHPTAGEVAIFGTRIDTLTGNQLVDWRASNVGFIFQFYNLLPTLSAEQNVEVPLLRTKLSRAARRKSISAALSLVGLADRAKHKPSELSGGQQQRVSIARALVSDPRLIVCDEPTGDLDRENADAVMRLLTLLSREQGKTVMMVTHDPLAAEYATRKVVMEKGRLLDSATEVLSAARRRNDAGAALV